MGRLLPCIVLLCCVQLSICLAQSQPQLVPTPRTYRLYGWKDAKGSWSFKLLPGEISREFSKKEVLHKKEALPNLEALRNRITELNSGSTLIWYDRVIDGGRYVHLGYPPEDIIEKVKQYAEARHLSILR